jgi:hypothetical protein
LASATQYIYDTRILITQLKATSPYRITLNMFLSFWQTFQAAWFQFINRNASFGYIRKADGVPINSHKEVLHTRTTCRDYPVLYTNMAKGAPLSQLLRLSMDTAFS